MGLCQHPPSIGRIFKDKYSGSKYFLLFKDKYSGYRIAYFIKNESDVLDHFKIFCNKIKNKFGRSIKVLHMDMEQNVAISISRGFWTMKTLIWKLQLLLPHSKTGEQKGITGQ